MSHTPGPWKLAGEEPFVYALNEAGTNRFFAHVQPGWITDGPRNRPDDRRTPDAELQANARLIAAAPELLEACKLALEYGDMSISDAAKVAAAIAKAEGK